MNNLRILIVEDNPSFALDVEMTISEMGYELVGKVDNGQDALLKIGLERPDLILMDIQLNGTMTGIDIAKKIKKLQIPVIFTTSYQDQKTYRESKEAYSFGYLVKPFNTLSLQSAIEMAFRSLQGGEGENSPENEWEDGMLMSEYFMIKHNGILQKVKISEVKYIKGGGNYSTLHTGKKRYIVKMSLRKMLCLLTSYHFVSIHKSYLAHLEHIDAIDTTGSSVKIGQDVLPLGRSFKPDLLNRYKLLK